MTTELSNEEKVERLRKEIKGIKFAMMTTVDEDGTLRSRPMATQQQEFDGDLWFFTWASSEKVHEVERNPQVNLSYGKEDDNRWVSISGAARLVLDKAKAVELWNPILKEWFPKYLEDPDLALIKENVEKAEYCDSA